MVLEEICLLLLCVAELEVMLLIDKLVQRGLLYNYFVFFGFERAVPLHQLEFLQGKEAFLVLVKHLNEIVVFHYLQNFYLVSFV